MRLAIKRGAIDRGSTVSDQFAWCPAAVECPACDLSNYIMPDVYFNYLSTCNIPLYSISHDYLDCVDVHDILQTLYTVKIFVQNNFFLKFEIDHLEQKKEFPFINVGALNGF